MSLSISIDTAGLKEAEEALEGVKNGFPKAVARSINAGLLAGRTEAAQLIRKRYNLKASAIKGGLEMKKAAPGRLEGSLEAKGPMLPLEAFNPKVRLKKSVGGKRTHQHVYAAIIKGKTKLIKGAFMPHGRVLERRQPERMPVFPVSVVGIPFMVGSLAIKPKIEERIVQAYETALKYNVQFYLNKGK